MDKRILLVGTVSNVAKTIEKELRIVCKALSVFDYVKIYLVESDSTDNTVEILEKIKLANANFDFTSLGILKEKLPHRIERIAYCRNYYVEYFRIKHRISNFDYVAVADLDGMNFRINKQGINSCFDSNIQWSGMMANQKFGYYDIYALRSKNWIEEDCFKKLSQAKQIDLFVEHKNSLLNFINAFQYFDKLRVDYIYKHMRILKRKNGLIPVDSAFGGFAIYVSQVFLTNAYSVDKTNFDQCEHVEFNLKLKSQGHLLYINPALVNAYFNSYNLNKFIFVRFVRECKKRLKLRYP